jgi:hypothetical protein
VSWLTATRSSRFSRRSRRFSSEDRELARKLTIEVESLARKPTTEWLYYLEDGKLAERFKVAPATLKKMVEAAIKANEKKAREATADNHRKRRQTESKQKQDDKAAHQKQERAHREAERARKETERIAHEEEVRRQKCEAVFAEIAELPRMTHETRLMEAAARLKEDPDTLTEEFEVFFASRSLLPELSPWPDPVNTG